MSKEIELELSPKARKELEELKDKLEITKRFPQKKEPYKPLKVLFG